MKRRTRKQRQKRQRTSTRKRKQRGGNIMNSVRPSKEAVLANPIKTDGGYKFEDVSMP